MDANYILSQFNFVAIFQGFILAIALLVVKKGEPTLNKLLGIMLLAFSWSGIYYNIDVMGNMHDYKAIAYTNALSDYMYNPLIFLYVYRLTVKGAKITWKTSLHFIPVVFLFFYYANYYFAPIETKTEIFNRGYNYFPYDVAYFAYLNLLQLLIYLVISGVLLNNYGKKISQLYSNYDKRNHNWLKFILITNLVSAVACFFLFKTSYAITGEVISILSALLIYSVGYKMISDPPRLPEVELIQSDSNKPFEQQVLNEENISAKYERSGLSEERAKVISGKLNEAMTIHKPWLDPEINLKQLADKVNCQSHHLSQVINQVFNKNFYDYVNEFRVEEIKSRIKNPTYDHLTLLAIAFDCGFNSKAAFNNAFKKITGKSPSEFKRTHMDDHEELAQII